MIYVLSAYRTWLGPRGAEPFRWARFASGPLFTALAVGLLAASPHLEFLDPRLPLVILLLTVAYGAFAGGIGSGLTSALLAATTAAYFVFSIRSGLIDDTEAIGNAAFLAAAYVGTGLTVGFLRHQADRQSEHALELERNFTRALAETNQRLQTANDDLLAFTYVVSHDLKEPVRGIDAYLRDLRDLQLDSAEREVLLTRAIDANARLSDLLRGLLAWSHAGQDVDETEPLSVRAVFKSPECRALYETLLRERGARLELADDLPIVMGTAPLLRQVLGNIVTNAMRHAGADGPIVRVTVGARGPSGLVEVVIEDNGMGFPQTVLARFREAKPSLGGGFGLTIARRAVERLGGRMSLENAPSGGARVVLELPEAP